MTTKGLQNLCVGAVQMISEDNEPELNISKALGFCDRAAKRGVQILCFPECSVTGFDWLSRKNGTKSVYKEKVPGPTVDRFASKAAETGMYIIMGIVEQGVKGIYNTAFLVGPEEGYMGRQRKVFAEKVFLPGTEANVFDTKWGRIGIFICADMRSPELARLLALKGARIFFQPTAYFHRDGLDIRRRYMGKCCSQRARSMENGIHLVAANIGRREYVNNSRIIVPQSQGPEEVLARATRKEQLLTAEVAFEVDANRARDQVIRSPELFRELGRTLLDIAGD